MPSYLVRPSITRSRCTAVIICQSNDPSIDRPMAPCIRQINHHACRSYTNRWIWMPSSSGYFVFSRLPPVVRCYTYISWTASSMYLVVCYYDLSMLRVMLLFYHHVPSFTSKIWRPITGYLVCFKFKKALVN
jgi:hypothetical protein